MDKPKYIKTSIKFPEEMHQRITEYAARADLNFSQAIRTLVNQSLDENGGDIELIERVSHATSRALGQGLNSYAKLMAASALSAEEANQRAGATLVMLMRLLQEVTPDDVHEQIARELYAIQEGDQPMPQSTHFETWIGADDGPIGREIMRIGKKRITTYRKRAFEKLKPHLDELQKLAQELAEKASG